MPSEALVKLLQEAEKLSDEERLELVMRLLEQFRAKMAHPRYRSWLELAGMAPYPLLGEDAQKWISRTRREGDERRMKQWE
ncbi:MAG: hypothetical protein N3B10_11845 [Armatimonadetes bacterium]|nr:hypothetical protein [Armatimonadota bacterium]